MTQTLRALYLLWLPIAVLCLVIPTRGQGNTHHLYARNALAREIASLKADYGNAIDTSLDGYDHELVATTMKKGRHRRSTAEVKQELTKEVAIIKAQYGTDSNKIDLSLDGYDLGDLEDHDEENDSEDEAEIETTTLKQKRSVPTAIVQEASAMKAEYGSNKIDLSLDGYDPSGLADDGEDDAVGQDNDDGTLESRDAGLAGSDDILGHILSRSTPLKNYEPFPNKAKFGGHTVDFSLEGYDLDNLDADADANSEAEEDKALLVTRRSDDNANDDEDEGETTVDQITIQPPNKSDFSPGVDFSLDGYDTEGLLRRDLEVEDDPTSDHYLISWDDEVRKRDSPDEGEVDVNDSDDDIYHGFQGDEILAAQATTAMDANREYVRRAAETAEEEI